MPRYLGVTAVREYGVRIERSFDPSPIETPQQTRLVGILGNGRWEVAPDMTHSADYLEIQEAYEEGYYTDYELYLLGEAETVKCPNEGRHIIS
jgi:hypothetical protein